MVDEDKKKETKKNGGHYYSPLDRRRVERSVPCAVGIPIRKSADCTENGVGSAGMPLIRIEFRRASGPTNDRVSIKARPANTRFDTGDFDLAVETASENSDRGHWTTNLLISRS